MDFKTITCILRYKYKKFESSVLTKMALTVKDVEMC
jgi:hypothetical protein